jgi:hypothetical protein
VEPKQKLSSSAPDRSILETPYDAILSSELPLCRASFEGMAHVAFEQELEFLPFLALRAFAGLRVAVQNYFNCLGRRFI